MAYIAAGDVSLPKLHLAHATGFNGNTYQCLLGPLSKTFSVRAWDARGHGKTSLKADPSSQKSWIVYAEDLANFIRTWTDEPILLAGHSMGGTVSLLMAAAYPELVRGVIAYDPPIMPRAIPPGPSKSPIAAQAAKRNAVFPSREILLRAYRGRGAFAGWPDDVLEDYVDGGTRTSPDGSIHLTCTPEWEAATFREHGHDTWDALSRLRVPVRLLVPDENAISSNYTEMPQLNPLIAVKVIPGVDHFYPLKHQAEMIGHILDFSSSL